MDCNIDAQIGQQLQKNAAMMHGGVHMDPIMMDQDALMQAPLMAPAMLQPQLGADWAQTFASQQHQQQQHEMHAFMQHQQQQLQQQQLQPNALVQPINATPGPMMMMNNNHQLMSGMMAATNSMSMGMMIPRTQYQSCLNLPGQSLAQTVNTVAPNVAVASVITNSMQDSAWSSQLGQQQWGQDYSQVQSFQVEGQTASTAEEKLASSAFYGFMDRIRNKEVLIDEEKGELVAGPGAEPEVSEDTEHLRNWATAEGLNFPAEVYQRPAAAAPLTTNMDSAVLAEDGMDLTEQGVEEWAKEYAEMQERATKAVNSTDYPFEPNNLYMHQENPFATGLELLQLSNLAGAALAFEAACQMDSDNFDAWRILGTTQAENEKDGLAILALNNARRLRPKDVGVHAALCVSHTNEHNTDAAMESLKAWLLNHPEYEQLGSIELPASHIPNDDIELADTFYFADPARVREVSTLYTAAMEMNPQDAQLYSNLGVLYNIAHDYTLAAEQFRRAVAIAPQEASMWNKLGATLANGGQTEQAIEAYTRALDINPGYVRAMYNMAVAYSNMGRYPSAVKQIIRTIAAQQDNTNPVGEGSYLAARGMWDLLRMTLSLMDRNDLVQLTHNRNLEPFIKEFGMEGLV